MPAPLPIVALLPDKLPVAATDCGWMLAENAPLDAFMLANIVRFTLIVLTPFSCDSSAAQARVRRHDPKQCTHTQPSSTMVRLSRSKPLGSSPTRVHKHSFRSAPTNGSSGDSHLVVVVVQIDVAIIMCGIHQDCHTGLGYFSQRCTGCLRHFRCLPKKPFPVLFLRDDTHCAY